MQSTPSRRNAAPTAPPEQIGWPVWRLALVIVFGAFTSGLDASLANIGLDTIGTDLHVGLATVQWVASGYLLALAVSLPLAGWLGRRLGVGRLWLLALGAFVVASGLCAAAPDVGSLVVLRVVQGLAGGLLIPAGQTVLGQAVGPRRLGRVMATLGIAVSLGPALGPVLGGLILHSASWRWLFAINVPIGVVGLLLGLRHVPRGERGRTVPLDRAGLAMISTGLPLVVFGLTEWGSADTPLAVTGWAPLLAGALALVAFVRHAGRRPDPLIDLSLFRNGVFAAATAASGLTGMLMFGSALLLPLWFQLAHGDDVITTGLHLLGMGVGTAVALPLVGRLVDRYGGGIVAGVGAAATLACAVTFAVAPVTMNPGTVQALLVAMGIATAFAAVPTGIAAFAAVASEQLGDATTTVSIALRVGGALGSALFPVVVAGRLAGGAEAAFQTAFWVMAAVAVLTLGAAVLLTVALRAR
jgi:EmrB/QacA subfamily drug resistance transporter